MNSSWVCWGDGDNGVAGGQQVVKTQEQWMRVEVFRLKFPSAGLS